MSKWVKLVYKGTIIDIEDGINYQTMGDFVPPGLAREINWNYGSYLSKSGGTRLSDRLNDREWSFTVRVSGSTIAETHLMARRVSAFLEYASDPMDKVYLEFHPDVSIPYQPIYGQQAIRYHIKAGFATIDPGFYSQDITKPYVVMVRLNLVVAPYAEGQRQHICGGYGGAAIDTVAPGGGLAIAEGNTNKFSNPIFQAGYGSWTFGTSLVYAINFDKRFILFGSKSLYIGADGTARQLYESINLGNTNTWTISFYAKKQDESAVTSSDVTVYYATSKTTTYQAVGNGWYRCFASVTGIASSQSTGVQVAANKNVYVDMFQVEEDAYPTHPFYGDMPGCTWASTPHASASTKTNASIYAAPNIDRTDYAPELTIRMVVRWHHANTHPNDRYLFSDSSTILAYLKASDDKIYFNSLSGSAQSFSAQAVYVYHFVISGSERTVYINGSQDSTTTGTSRNTITGIEIGGQGDLSIGNFTLLDYTMWDRAATGAQVLADYTNITQYIAADTYGHNMTPPCWYSALDANEVDNYYDSTHQDWITIGNVPGDLPAETILWITPLVTPTNAPLLLNLFTSYKPFSMGSLFSNLAGNADAAALGGSALAYTLGTADATLPTTGSIVVTYWQEELVNKNLYLGISLREGGTALTSLNARAKVFDSSGNWGAYSPYNVLATGTVYKTYLVGPLAMPEVFANETWAGTASSFTIGMSANRASGSGTIYFDYYRPMFEDIAYFPSGGTTTYYYVRDGDVKGFTASTFAELPEYRGDIIELKPMKYNYLTMWWQGINANTDTTKYKYLSKGFVVPRWGLL